VPTAEADDEGVSKAEQSHAYACHCEKCGGVVAVCVADADDVDEVVSEWMGWDNTYVERHTVEVARKLPMCEHAWEAA